MNTENKAKVITFLESQSFSSTIDFNYHLKDNDFSTVEEIEEILNDAGAFDTEIIYYSTAIEFLKEHDNSLRRSLEIAHDYGYEPKNLSSETLASLLASQMLRDEFSEIRSELEDFINDLEESESEEEYESDKGEEEEELYV
jgi:intracellular sulfur oxidation DsrE/DsrF family protein